MRSVPIVMSAEQCRAGRAWLDGTKADLARLSRVGLSTIKDFESGGRRTIAATLAQMQQTLERAGVRFQIDANGMPSGISVAPTGAFDDLLRDFRRRPSIQVFRSFALWLGLVCSAVDHLDSASDKDLPGSHRIEKDVVGPERNFGLVDLHHALQRLAVGINHRIVAASAPATKPSCR